MNDHKGAKLVFDAPPPAPVLIADKGYDSDEFRATLISRGTTPCITPRKHRKTQHAYCKTLYRQPDVHRMSSELLTDDQPMTSDARCSFRPASVEAGPRLHAGSLDGAPEKFGALPFPAAMG